ncbi:MAG: choice-of-anchor D domain-containing protein [Burkholderiales bacterium]|nr:choice-of-anchor D domain-containing protein [Burkholderiales bacterium]
MVERCLGIKVWLAGLALVLGALCLPGTAEASTYSTGTNACSGCHGNAGLGTPPALPSQGSNILLGADLTQSCAGGGCSLRTVIATNPNMTGSNVTGNFSNAELDTVRIYLLSVLTASVSTPSPSFTPTAIGFTSTDSFSLTISNGRADSIGYSFSISGANAGDFAIQSRSQSGSCSSSSVNATASTSAATCNVTLTVRFQPTGGVAGTRNANLNVNLTANDGTDPAPTSRSFAISGQALTPAPIYQASTNSISFTSRLGSSVNQSMTITNSASATANLVLTAFNFSVPQYTRSGSSTCAILTSLTPGSSCTLTVTFTPTAAGTQNGSLSISHNASGSPDGVTLNGSGTQSLINPTTATLAFGNVQQGVPKVLNQVVTNTGTTTLNFSVNPSSPAAKSGAAAADYAVTGTCTTVTPLAALGGTCNLIVTLTPSALGARPATLTISSDATNGPLVITLTGTGVALPEPVVTPPASDFPDTVINQTSAQTRTVTIQNDRVRNVTYAVSDSTDFKIGAESCAGRVVPGNGGVCTIQIQFSPTLGAGEGRRTATLPFTFTGVAPDPDPSTVNVDVAGNALLPLAQSASSLNAAAVVGSPTTTSMLLTNRSSSAITLSTLVFSGAAGSDYSLAAGNTCTPALVLAASTSCTLVVRFNPPVAGTRNATLTISHSAAGSPQTVAFLGTATPAPQGLIQLSSSALTYADTQLASTSAQTITVHNGGDLALNFSAFTLGGVNPGDYLRSGTCAVGTPLAIAADCTVIVTFAPAALGLRTATLSIASDASNGTAVITLSGTGVPIPAPQVSLTPTTLDFGTQTIAGLYPARRIRLANSGTADLTVASVTVSGAGFAVASAACPALLAPGVGCDIDIAFTPVAAQAYVGSLTVVSNAAGSPHSTVLRGTGSAAAVPVLVFSPATSTLDFGSVSAGSVSAAQTVTVLNQGPGGATLTLLNAVGGDAASFSVVGGTCAIGAALFEGGTCTISVQFAPGSSGTKTATVQIASTGSFPPVLTLTGVGLAGPNPSLALSTSALAFASTRIGSQSLPSTLRISSSGSGVVTVSAIAVTGAYAIDSSTCPALPFTLPAGTDCTVAVSFRPTTEGTAAGTLSVTSDAAPAVRDVALSGSGDPTADTSSGGCTIGDPAGPADPLLWAMVLLAAAWLFKRQRQRKRASTRAQQEREPLN